MRVGRGSPSGLSELSGRDEEVAGLARAEGALRLRLGQALEVLGRGGYAELGFSSIAAYGVERCERTARWVEAARCLARRLEGLPVLRRALARGSVSWSMAELVARVATRETEVSWLRAASNHTVRQMREVVASALAARIGHEREAVELTESAASGEASEDAARALSATTEDACVLSLTVPREEAWLFEATRRLLEHLGERTADEQLEALLAEGQGSLLAALPRSAVDEVGAMGASTARRRRREELRGQREGEEAAREGHIARGPHGMAYVRDEYAQIAVEAAAGWSSLSRIEPGELDAMVRSVCEALAAHELELCRRLLELQRAGGAKALGYASEKQYARERLGMSLSALLSRRALAARLKGLPRAEAALGNGELGVEAVLQVARIATAETEAAWLERARRRTIKHLREEVAAALVAVRLSGDIACPPPENAELDRFHELERAVVSGEVCRRRTSDAGSSEREGGSGGPAQGAWPVALGSLAHWLESGLQMSAGLPGRASLPMGRVELRLRVSAETHDAWRALEAWAQRWLPKGMTWLRYTCLALWRSWEHLFDRDVAYRSVYVRDRFRCTSPVCSREDVTPHHIVQRSAGGGDEDENVTALCVACHLFGVHGGRIRVEGKAPDLRWELGRGEVPCLVVKGRERVAA